MRLVVRSYHSELLPPKTIELVDVGCLLVVVAGVVDVMKLGQNFHCWVGQVAGVGWVEFPFGKWGMILGVSGMGMVVGELLLFWLLVLKSL